MPQIAVTIAGRAYRMTCGEGEEEHLQDMGRRVDAKIAELKGLFGEIGDQRLTVMAAITMADEASEAERRLGALQADLAAARDDKGEVEAALHGMGDAVAQEIEEAAARLERVSQAITAGRRG